MRTLLVCGSGRTLFSDLEALGVRAQSGADRFDIFAVNDALLALPMARYFASYHDELFESWLLLRKRKHYQGRVVPDKKGLKTFGQRKTAFVDELKVFQIGGGTSVLYAAQCALSLRPRQNVILCGAPLDAEGRFYEPVWQRGHDYRVTDGWLPWQELHADSSTEAKERLRSMSGHTRALLGAPPYEWYAPTV